MINLIPKLKNLIPFLARDIKELETSGSQKIYMINKKKDLRDSVIKWESKIKNGFCDKARLAEVAEGVRGWLHGNYRVGAWGEQTNQEILKIIGENFAKI